MSLLGKLFGPRDPWERVSQPYSIAIQRRLSDDEFRQLTALLRKYDQFTPEILTPAVAQRSQREICGHVAGVLLHLAFRFSEALAKLNSKPALRMGDLEHPAHLLIRECLTLSIALEPEANPASLMLPGYLLDAGLADVAVATAARALPEWDRRIAEPVRQPATDRSSTLDAILAEFLTQAGGDAGLVDGVREIAQRTHAIERLREALSESEYATLRACLASFLRTREILVDPNTPAIERYPLRPGEVSLLSGWIVSSMSVLREHFSALDLLRVAHVLQPDFANVNEVLADIYFRSLEGPDDDGGETRRRAQHHARLAAAGMKESLADPDGLEGTGLTPEEMRGRLARMEEILAAVSAS